MDKSYLSHRAKTLKCDRITESQNDGQTENSIVFGGEWGPINISVLGSTIHKASKHDCKSKRRRCDHILPFRFSQTVFYVHYLALGIKARGGFNEYPRSMF